MASPQFRTYEYWTQLLHAAVIGRSGITSVAATSGAHVFLSAEALCLDQLSFNAGNVKLIFDVDTAAGPDLDARAAEIVPNTLARIPAQPATALLTFSRQTSSGAVFIGAGTRVTTQDGQTQFATLADTTLAAGQASIANVAAQAQVPGVAGQVAAHTLIAFGSKPVGIDNVDNPAAAYGGSDQENDDSFRQRIRLYVASLSKGTEQAFVYGMLGVADPITGDTIQHASVVTYPTRPYYIELYVADSAGTNEGRSTVLSAPEAVPEVVTAGLLGPIPNTAVGGETHLALNHLAVDSDAAHVFNSSTRGALSEGAQVNVDYGAGVLYFSPALAAGEKITATYSYFTGVIAQCQKVVNGDKSDWKNYPGLCLAGQMVRVRSPQVSLVGITANLVVDPTYDHAEVLSDAQAAASGYVAGLGIGESVVFTRLVAVVMNVPGVTKVTFTTPTNDLVVGETQIARPGTLSFA